MANLIKEEKWIGPLQIAGGIIAALSLVPFVLDDPLGGPIAAMLIVFGLGLMGYGYLRAHRFDPNAGDPAPRKLLGQQHAVWGEQLAELRAKAPQALPGYCRRFAEPLMPSRSFCLPRQ